MNKVRTAIITLMVSCFFFSCKKIVADLNVDPNNPANAPASLTFTGTELANMSVQEGMASRLGTIWSGYLTGADRQWRDYYSYNVTAGVFDGDWNNVFSGTIKNGIVTITKATELGNRKMIGITKVIEANALATATELWGDIPVDQAGKILEFPNPKFESQVTGVYPKVLAMLNDAIGDLQSGIGSVGSEDVYFSGDATRWKQVAYTLKARLFTDMKMYDSAYAAAQTGVSAYGNSLYAPHGTTSGVNLNLFNDFLTNQRTGDINAVGAFAVSVLNPASAVYRGNSKTIETARYKFYYLESGVNSPGKVEPNTTTTTTARGFFAKDASFPITTYQENILTLAETALRTGKGFDAALIYLNQYRSFLNTGGYIHSTYLAAGTYKYDPYVAADFAAGGIENKDQTAAANALLREIMEERYISFYGTHLGWNDVRRTGSDPYGIKLPANNGTQLPGRFLYSQNEINSNANAPRPIPGTFEPLAIYK